MLGLVALLVAVSQVNGAAAATAYIGSRGETLVRAEDVTSSAKASSLSSAQDAANEKAAAAAEAATKEVADQEASSVAEASSLRSESDAMADDALTHGKSALVRRHGGKAADAQTSDTLSHGNSSHAGPHDALNEGSSSSIGSHDPLNEGAPMSEQSTVSDPAPMIRTEHVDASTVGGLSSPSELSEVKPAALVEDNTMDVSTLMSRQTQHSPNGTVAVPEWRDSDNGALLDKSVATKGSRRRRRAIPGKWHSWGGWSGCSKGCGGGTQKRSRGKTNPAHGGKPASGASSETKSCNTHKCPIDCKWANWGTWSTCTKTCGGGETKRTRKNSAAAHGGKACTGDAEEKKDCKKDACPTTTTTKPPTTPPPKAGATKGAVWHAMLSIVLFTGVARACQ